MLLSFSSRWLKAILSAAVPFWLFLFVLSLGIFIALELYRYWKISSDLRKQNEALESERKNAEVHEKALDAGKERLEASNDELRAEKHHLQQQVAAEKDLLQQQIAELTGIQAEKYHLEQQIAELTSSEPRLHGVWSNSQTYWHMDRKGAEQVMQIGGRIQLASSNTDEVLHLLAGYIEGQRMDLLEPVSVRPDLIEDEQVVLYISPPLEADSTRSFTATIALEDHQNRLHTLRRHSFRPTEQAAPWSTER